MELTQTPTILFSEEVTQIGGKNYLREPFFQIYPQAGFPIPFQCVVSCVIPGIEAEVDETFVIQVEFVNKYTNESLFLSEKIPVEVKGTMNSLTLNFDKMAVSIAQVGIYEARLSIDDKVVATNELAVKVPIKLA